MAAKILCESLKRINGKIWSITKERKWTINKRRLWLIYTYAALVTESITMQINFILLVNISVNIVACIWWLKEQVKKKTKNENVAKNNNAITATQPMGFSYKAVHGKSNVPTHIHACFKYCYQPTEERVMVDKSLRTYHFFLSRQWYGSSPRK